MTVEFVECSLHELDPGELAVRVAHTDVNQKDAFEVALAWSRATG